jgi:hypothetical protein
MGDADPPLELLHNAFVTIQHWPSRRLLVVTRSAAPITQLAEVDEAWGSVVAALSRLDKTQASLLIDMRKAIGRNDDAYERAVARHRAATVEGFARVAVLVRSMPGQLQVQRHMKEDRLSKVRIFNAEPDALAWLAEG